MKELEFTYYLYYTILIDDIKLKISDIMGIDNRIILNIEYII